MRRRERTRILIEGDRSLARRIASGIEASLPVTVLDDPREGLVMVKVRESAKRQQFFLGEVLMTSCRVKVNGSQGLGMAMGDDRDLAYDLAVIDAACSLDEGQAELARWEEELLAERGRIDAAARQKRAVANKTRVDFSTMEVEL